MYPRTVFRDDELLQTVKTVLQRIQIDFGGGCSVSKAYLLAWLIRRYDLKCTVDIGVYRGRSLFPQACAHAGYSGGVVYGIDPWSPEEASESDNLPLREDIEKWVRSTDFQRVFEEVTSLKSILRLDSHCILLRLPSEEAISFFVEREIQFDLVHVDGNHDTLKVMADIDLYFPRLRRGGFLVLDDISWDSVLPAYRRLRAEAALVCERQNGVNDDYAVFYNGPLGARALTLRLMLAFVSRVGAT